MGTAHLATNANLQQPRFHAQQRGPHQDSFVLTPAEESVAKDASLLETETFALEIIPYVMVRLSVVSLMVATSMTVEQWVVV